MHMSMLCATTGKLASLCSGNALWNIYRNDPINAKIENALEMDKQRLVRTCFLVITIQGMA